MAQEDFSEFVNDFDSWTCVICREGDGANDSRTLHECQKHEFHTKCLEEERRRDIRCPICRFTSSATPVIRTLSVDSVSQSPPTTPISLRFARNNSEDRAYIQQLFFSYFTLYHNYSL